MRPVKGIPFLLMLLPQLNAQEATPTLGYRGVLQPSNLPQPDGRPPVTDIWRLSAAQGLPQAEKSAASTRGYGWLTSGAESWNMVNTFSALEPDPDRRFTRYARPGDYFYIYPIQEIPGPATPGPIPATLPAADPYRDPSGRNTVRITANPSPAADEKVFVRYTLDTWDAARQQVVPRPVEPGKQRAAAPEK